MVGADEAGERVGTVVHCVGPLVVGDSTGETEGSAVGYLVGEELGALVVHGHAACGRR